MNRIKRYLINIALALFTIILVLCIAEGILRLFDYKKPLGARQMRYYYKPDDIAGFDIVENCPTRRIHHEGNYYIDIWSNELGCFDRPYKQEKDYILLVGDSFTHQFSSFENKWGTLLESSIGMRVLKCGVSGYGTRQELLKAEKIVGAVKHVPKLVVIGYFLNDLDDDYRFPPFVETNGFLVEKKKIVDYKTGAIEVQDDASLERHAKSYERKIVCSKYDECSGCSSVFKRWKCYIIDNSVLSGRIRHATSQIKSIIKDMKVKVLKEPKKSMPLETDMLELYPIKDFPWLYGAWENHFENLRDFKRFTDKNGTNLLVVIIPAKEQVYPYFIKNKSIDLEQPNRFLSGFFQRESILYVDLLEPFRKYARKGTSEFLDPEKDLYMRLDKHWSKKGEYLANLIVSHYIIEKGLVDVPDREKRLEQIRKNISNFN